MAASLPGARELPASRYDLDTYWGRVRQSMAITDMRTLFVTSAGLERSKKLLTQYKMGEIPEMTPELWKAKKVVDSTLHPDTGQPVFLPFRMSCFVLSNLVVTAGMLTPGLKTPGTIAWQITNQTLNVCINAANANKSTPLPPVAMWNSFFLAVSASCSVAVGLRSLVARMRASPIKNVSGRLVPFAAVASAGALNVFLMRSEEIKKGIDVYTWRAKDEKEKGAAAPGEAIGADGQQQQQQAGESLGKSRKAALVAVKETAISRVLNAMPIMVLPPLISMRLQKTQWLIRRPNMLLPVNLGLILATSIFALPLALAIYPQREYVRAETLEPEFHDKGGGDWNKIEFNRGI